MGNVFTSLISKVFAAYGVASIIAMAGLGAVIAGKNLKISRQETQLVERKATIDDLVAASNLSAEKARSARLKTERDYLELARETDREAAKLVGQARTDAERYIARNRVRGPGAPCDTPSGAGAAGEDNTARDSNAAGGVPQLDDLPNMVAVTEDDVRICTTNTLQAIAARDWALKLGTTTN